MTSSAWDIRGWHSSPTNVHIKGGVSLYILWLLAHFQLSFGRNRKICGTLALPCQKEPAPGFESKPEVNINSSVKRQNLYFVGRCCVRCPQLLRLRHTQGLHFSLYPCRWPVLYFVFMFLRIFADGKWSALIRHFSSHLCPLPALHCATLDPPIHAMMATTHQDTGKAIQTVVWHLRHLSWLIILFPDTIEPVTLISLRQSLSNLQLPWL